MSDEFNNQKKKHIGLGGIKCHCCNNFHGKSKKKLNRIARARLKRIDKMT